MNTPQQANLPIPNSQLPTTYRKLLAQQLSPDFATAVTIETVDVPPLGPHQLLVKNQYAGVNGGFDTLLCRGDIPYFNPEPPFDLGVEAVGTIVAVGTGVTKVKVGDAIATTTKGGGYREYQIINVEDAIPIREAIPEILTLIPTGISALVGLEQAGEMGSNETVLITAAAGGIGHIAVQLAKLGGNHVIGTCGSQAKAALLRQLGCDRVINYREDDVDQVLHQHYPQGIDLVFDCVGGRMFDLGINHLATRGRFVIVGFISEYGKPLEAVTRPRIYDQLFWKAASVRGFLLPQYAEAIPSSRDRLLNLFYTQQLRVAVDPTEFWHLESIPAAVNHLLSGQNCGKVVVRYGSPDARNQEAGGPDHDQ